jgi:hypothetical protein
MPVRDLPTSSLSKDALSFATRQKAFFRLSIWSRYRSCSLILEALPTVKNEATKVLLFDHGTKSLRLCGILAKVVPDLLHTPTTSLYISFVRDPEHTGQFFVGVECGLDVFNVKDWNFWVEKIVAVTFLTLAALFVDGEVNEICYVGDDSLSILETNGHAECLCFVGEFSEVVDCIFLLKTFAILFVIVGI